MSTSAPPTLTAEQLAEWRDRVRRFEINLPAMLPRAGFVHETLAKATGEPIPERDQKPNQGTRY